MLDRLHQSEMAFRQDESLDAWQAAEDRNGERGRFTCFTQQRRVPITSDAVEDDRGDPQSRPVRSETADDGRCTRCLGPRIDHENYGPTARHGEIGGGPAIDGGAVEQSHDTLADDNFAGLGQSCRSGA